MMTKPGFRRRNFLFNVEFHILKTLRRNWAATINFLHNFVDILMTKQYRKVFVKYQIDVSEIYWNEKF